MSPISKREVDSQASPVFGDESEELTLLRKLAKLLRSWDKEEDGVSKEEIFSLLKDVEKCQRLKRRKH